MSTLQPDKQDARRDPGAATHQDDVAISWSLEATAPHHRSIVGIDVKDSTRRTNVARGTLRRVMYDLLEEAMLSGGIDGRYRDDWQDRGDGVLGFVHPVDQAPKTLLLGTIIPMLSKLLAVHNASHPEQAVRMRAVVHAGEIHFDGRGYYGEAVDLACRLLDSPELKRRFRQIESDLILVVSDDIYRSVVRHGYAGIVAADFAPSVHVHLGGVRHRGWVNVPRTELIPAQATGSTTGGWSVVHDDPL